jgi:hypothetical protein
MFTQKMARAGMLALAVVTLSTTAVTPCSAQLGFPVTPGFRLIRHPDLSGWTFYFNLQRAYANIHGNYDGTLTIGSVDSRTGALVGTLTLYSLPEGPGIRAGQYRATGNVRSVGSSSRYEIMFGGGALGEDLAFLGVATPIPNTVTAGRPQGEWNLQGTYLFTQTTRAGFTIVRETSGPFSFDGNTVHELIH